MRTEIAPPLAIAYLSAQAMMGRGLRLYSPGRVVDEMERPYDEHGLNYFGFVDDNLTLKKQHILSIEGQVYLKPYNMTVDKVLEYENRFDEMRMLSRRARSLQDKGGRS